MNLFGTAGIRGSAEERVTPELALSVGRAVGAEAVAASAADETPEVVVGRDGRVTGPSLVAAVESGVTSAGADVVRVGVLPTPALAFASRGRHGVMLTASHNPPTDNGIKVFDDAEEIPRGKEEAVEERVGGDNRPAPWDHWGEAGEESPLRAYRRAVADYVRETGSASVDPGVGAGLDGEGDGDETPATPLDGLRVAADCGNGMGSVATPQVLRALGAEVVTLNANVDGHFPGRESKPTPESLHDLREFLADAEDSGEPFDFGLGHDGDADRIVVVAPDGEVVHEDTVVAILAEHYVRSVEAEAGVDDPVVVTTPNASGRIDERVEAAGGRVERVRLGALHEGIASARADGGDVVFAAEPWKHVHTRFGGWIDGVASAAVLADLVASKGLAALRAPVTERPYEKMSIACADDAKAATMAGLETALPEAFPDAESSTEHGVRLSFPDGSWVLVRPSGTEPYVRIYAESDEVERLVAEAREVVESAVAAAER
ncbi:phosphomannomutase [Halobium salinum]|uniref:Phosphomannomutase n=1 Tax=Halobium salinum TaxID=1364940 RepID=A0ABD5P6C1_9EURY|nr:phosphomannomutase [Halobium salinum]